MIKTNTTHYLSNEERSYIFILHNEGFSYNTIKAKFKGQYHKLIYDSTINDICKKVRVTSSVETLNKSGRPPNYNEREQRAIVRACLKEPTTSIRELVEEEDINPKGASRQTISRILSSHKVFTRVLSKQMSRLTKDQVKARRNFAEHYLHWDFYDWQLVIFSDEADLIPTKCGKKYVRLKEGQSLVDVVPPKEKAEKLITIKVWGAISSLGVGPLVRYEGTMKASKYLDILIRHLFQAYPMLEGSIMEEEGSEDALPPWSFVQDNARPHTAKIIQKWSDNNQVNFLEWPSNSPDLNIIENVWAYVQDKLYDIQDELISQEETWQRVQEIWSNIPLTFIQDLYKDLPSRVKHLKIYKGGPISQ